jgi:hypothetical protein
VDSGGSGYGSFPGSYEHDNELSGSVKFREFLDQLSNRKFLRGFKCLLYQQTDLQNKGDNTQRPNVRLPFQHQVDWVQK